MKAMFQFLSQLSFRSKINLGLALIIICFGLLLGILGHAVLSRTVLNETFKRGQTLVMNLSARSVESILSQNFLRLTVLVTEIDQIRDQGDIAYAFILDRHGQVLAHSFREGFPAALRLVNPVADHQPYALQLLDTGTERIYDFAAPVVLDNVRLGTVRVALSDSTIMASNARLLRLVTGVTAAATLLALIGGSFFARTVTKRINALRTSTEAVIKGELGVQASDALGRNCWELRDCREAHCPAYGDRQRRCWFITGTICPECDTGGFPEKVARCLNCPVYQQNVGDEIQSLAESFDFMAWSLKNHIDELNDSRKNLARQKQLLKTILDVTPDLVALQDEKLAYLAVNKAFCRHIGLQEQEIVGRTDYDILGAEQADRNFHEDKQILLTRQPLSKELMTMGGEGRKWHHVVKVPVIEQDRIIGLLSTARDITVVKQYQEKLIQSQKMEDLGRLAGGVAHEINTPLSIILGYAQLLRKEIPADNPVGQDLAIIEKQAQTCRKIVADLLSFSRSAEKSESRIDINASIREVTDLVAQIFQQNRITITHRLDDQIPPVSGDKERLKQVWINLLNNAADAIGTDGCILVKTKLCAHRRRLVVSITDTGGGIDDQHLDKIFEPFFTTKSVDQGTGLGLSVTFGIIKDHGGRISALSPVPADYMDNYPPCEGEPGPGTVLFVELPLEGKVLPDDECIEIPGKA
ncbi:ATP-binding protein [Desulfatitalea alkaliphila]|uniref:histidine kinase n=1 Tax=Desulfatitalea alkaliphila TaxID=2929485 RepID=A0AA41R2E8_9BACT|nr:ATP-binding protein [Desulfatitalea alkaliphila]MCJ8500842.1 ATP-binding protein [Desulfatitalea alkaliphila]